MRRALLIVALIVLLLVDIAIVPMALLLAFIGGIFSIAGVGGPLPMAILFSVLAVCLLGLTFLVGRAAVRA